MDIRDYKAKDILNDISYYLRYGNNEEARKLWWVLSALRGPDNNSDELKNVTTEVIRDVAFGRGTVDWVGAYTSPDTPRKKECRTSKVFLERESRGLERNHFFWHAKKAFEVLGIDWGTDISDLKVFML